MILIAVAVCVMPHVTSCRTSTEVLFNPWYANAVSAAKIHTMQPETLTTHRTKEAGSPRPCDSAVMN